MDIKQIRISKGMTQAQLAKATGLSQQHISKIEKGKIIPFVSTLEKIFKALGCRIDIKENDYDRKTS